ncbi:hypothetical protein [Novosphingobium sp.]|uniref:hypothetical protein n=1 Tax=Novosphingobium sp. TaxID=1874826 RepID=UPI0025E973F0|nr:hypothetical protein [Novosphingobium sp.]
MMRKTVCILLMMMAGCNKLTPEQRAQEDAAAIRQVEEAQKIRAPAQPIAMQGLEPGDGAAAGLSGPGCTFTPDGQDKPVLVADRSRAIIKLDDEPSAMAVDVGADGRIRHYVGKAYTIYIDQGTDVPSSAGSRPGAVLTAQDPDRREVYRASGTLACAG